MTSILPIPVQRYLVPDAPESLPSEVQRVRQPLLRGLPATFQLDGELALVLFVPTGDATLWRDSDASKIVAAAADEIEPRGATGSLDTAARSPVRFVLQRSTTNIATVPLRAGLRMRLPGNARSAALLELSILDFAIHAGTLREAGDFGSFIDFAWRRIDAGSDRFGLPPIDPRVAERFAGQFQSQVGEDT